MDLSSKPQMLSLVDKKEELKQQLEIFASNLTLMGQKFIVLRNKTGLYLYKLTQEA
jgi:hypothetical protein